MPTFREMCDGAIALAGSETPFTLSRAQEEAALLPVIEHLRSLPDPWPLIRESVHPGTYSALALEMFKKARLEAAANAARAEVELKALDMDEARAKANKATRAWMEARHA